MCPFSFYAIKASALERLGCHPKDVVGDSWKADILGARQAGIRWNRCLRC